MVQWKKLCCFDIDHTLVRSNIPTTKGVRYALSKGFNRHLNEVEVTQQAGTAMAVAREYLEGNGITRDNTANYDAKIMESKAEFKSFLEDGIREGRFFWEPLPHVIELLEELSSRGDIKLALLSANPREVAEMKLSNAGIDIGMFLVGSELIGAFGCEEEERSGLVKKLWSRYCRINGLESEERIDPNAMVIIGDTPNDIACAHDNNVPCVAVATGEYSPGDLREAEFVLRNFEDVSATIDILLQAVRSISR